MDHIPNTRQPAFPFQCQGSTTGPEIYYGLTKMEHFALTLAAAHVAAGKSSNSATESALIQARELLSLLD